MTSTRLTDTATPPSPTGRFGIDRQILRLSIPAIVSNVTVPLLGLSDTAISGHLGSELYLAAIAVGSMMLNVLFWLFGFLRMGTTGLAATAYGRGDGQEQRLVLSRAVFLAVAVGTVMIVLQGPLVWLLMLAVDPPADVRALVSRYFGICIFEAPALLGTMAVSGWFVGMQTTLWPMVVSITVNLVNIVLSIMLVFGFGMGFVGTAWGTLAANWLGFGLALFLAHRYTRGAPLWVGIRKVMGGDGMKKFFRVNANLFFRSFCITAVTLGVTAAGSRLGSLTLAVNAVLMQFFTLFSFFMDGFAFSAEALTGKWHGSGNSVMLRRTVRHLLWWSAGVAVAFGLLYVAGGRSITGMLTDDATVRRAVGEMLPWIWMLPPVAVWAFIYDGFYIGLTDTGRMLLSTLLASVAFYALVFLLPGDVWPEGWGGNDALWLAFVGYLGIRGLVLAALWTRVMGTKGQKT